MADSRVGRRGMLGAGSIGVAALAAAAITGTSKPAAAQAITDTVILNFALNFEYLGAELYLHGLFGTGLAASAGAASVTGVGTQGTVTAGGPVPFTSVAIQSVVNRLAVDEQAHVLFLRQVLGASAIAEPTINLSSSWTALALAAGLIQPGQTFNPYGDQISFLLAAYALEDVCVTALAGAAALLTTPSNVTGAAGLIGTEGYQAGTIRALLADLGAGAATDAISNLRATLSGAPNDFGTNAEGSAYNFVPTDINSLVFRRTPQQVLSIAYGGGRASGGFFPNGVNGSITTVS